MAEEQYKLDETNEQSPVMTVVGDGRAVNRVTVVGTLMRVEELGDNGDVLRGVVYAGDGQVSITAGQYSKDAQAFLREHQGDTPLYVSVTAKISLNETEDTTYVNLDAENMTVVGDVDSSETPDAVEQWLGDATVETLEAVNETIDSLDEDDNTRELDVWQNNHDKDDLRTVVEAAESVREEHMT